MSKYHSSLGSGRLLCKEMMSLAYWLNALFFQPSSMRAFTSGDGLSSFTGLPISPGAPGSFGGGTTPSSWCSGSGLKLQGKSVDKTDQFDIFVTSFLNAPKYQNCLLVSVAFGRRFFCDDRIFDNFFFGVVVIDVFDVVGVDIGQTSMWSCSSIASQRCRFCPTSGLVWSSVCRRPVVVVHEQGYCQPENRI